jgi:hypothetical protein
MAGNLISLLLLNLFVVAMAAGAAWFGWRGYTLSSNGETTMAHVVSLTESDDGEGGCCVYSPVFEYTVNGRGYSFESMNASYPPAYQVGDETEIIYNVDDPSDAAVNSFSELWLVATLLGAATVVVAVLLNWFALGRMRRGEAIFDSD